MQSLRVDLHIHTIASPCAEIEMLPSLVVERAIALGIGCIAITDHNTAENVEAVQRCAVGKQLAVIPGMEVQTREEAHVLCLFDTLAQVLQWQEMIYAALPSIKNREDVFGSQLVVDENDQFVHMIDRMLLVATSFSVDEVVSKVRQLGGIVIAAHVDRQAYSLLAVLGFIPGDLDLAGLEISRATQLSEARRRFPQLGNWPLITNSDAHRLGDMQVGMQMLAAGTSVQELELAIGNQLGRSLQLANNSILA
ncbi:MAG: PHP domain-containing protein [Anaerolineae bacterium]